MSGLPVSPEIKKQASDVMDQGLKLVDLFVNKNYLIDVDECIPIPLDESEQTFEYMSLFQIDKIVFDENENINDKLVSVYSALSSFGSSALLIIDSNKTGVRFFLGTRDKRDPYVAKKILQKSLHGNFPGISIREQNSSRIEELLESHIPDTYNKIAVSSVSIVPSMRDKDKDNFVQGIEKFIDSMAGEDFIGVFISKPLSKQELEDKKRGYEAMYTALSQFAQMNLTYMETDSTSVALGASNAFSNAVNNGISSASGRNSGTNKSTGNNSTHGFNFGLFVMGFEKGGGRTVSDGAYDGTTFSNGETHSTTNTTTHTDTKTDTTLKGKNASIQLTKQNKTVQELMKKIDEQLARIKNCESYGLWDSACYFLAQKQETAIVAANTYKALVAGEKTCVENSFINEWDNNSENAERSLCIMDYLRYGMHPRFIYKPEFAGPEYDQQQITAASLISGLELPIFMGLPHKSVSGVTSVVSAEFGRNIFTKNPVSADRSLDLGAIYHMGEIFGDNRVLLNTESLTSHCFITGSTGTGKSNTTYKIIDELITEQNNVKFLVIEPAKGEYKLVFGGMKDINIFTTNPKYFSMLRLNPFEFNENIHILEHLDRLIEIFSACWPLYAAMPAVLKQSFERAYIMHGWDLNHSTYTNMGNGRFPTFKDVVDTLPKVMNESNFSAEVKGNYIGSLSTRIESLTNGLAGQIFSSVGIEDEVLFDQNTIVDLSRVGSVETKSLLMGVIVLKLSEYRQATATGTNLPLQHVTIMEEAHNLLKRTSKGQSMEHSNVQGKSVEMISNSIAEMRTYGEGFIIVDQSPSAVDISAIKNTNTKIVMRLPEADDCEAVGRSIGLDENQIRELSRLDSGVAAVYQNDWLETVLVKIDKYVNNFDIPEVVEQDLSCNSHMLGELLYELISQDEIKKMDLPALKKIVIQSPCETGYESSVVRLLDNYKNEYDNGNKKFALPELIIQLLNCNDLLRIYDSMLPNVKITKKSQFTDDLIKKIRNWSGKVYQGLDRYADFSDKHTKDIVFLDLIRYQIENSKNGDKYRYVLYYLVKYSGKKQV